MAQPEDSNPRIEDYALIGDTRSAALIAKDGSLDWLCWPRFDSPALFLKILDCERGGFCSLIFDRPIKTSRKYIDKTNVLVTTFLTPQGQFELTDFMPLPEGDAPMRVVRILKCVKGVGRVRWAVRPTFDFAEPKSRSRVGHSRPTPRQVELTFNKEILLVDCAHPLESVAPHEWQSLAELREGQSTSLVLTYQTQAGTHDIDLEQLRVETVRRWVEWSHQLNYRGPERDEILRSVLCLKLLTYSPTGAIVAAPTLGLPESIGGERNWDYRLTWLRDSSFTVGALVALGFVNEARCYVKFLKSKIENVNKERPVFYTISETPLPLRKLKHLSGYENSSPVSAGNPAEHQLQLDIFAEEMRAYRAYYSKVGVNGMDREEREDLRTRVAAVVDLVAQHWQMPDNGIWEVPGKKQHFLHSKGMCWLAIVHARELYALLELTPPTAWKSLAEEIQEEYLRRGWSEKHQSYMQAYDSDEMDASVLRLVVFGALDAKSQKVKATVEAIVKKLGHDDLFYRYTLDDGLRGQEGAFLACSFWVASCYALMGEDEKAQTLFAKLRARANDVGLYSEQIEVASGRFLGNFPQGFTHMALINARLRIEHQPNPVSAAQK